MKTLKDLTPEIRAKISTYKEKCTKDLYSGVEYDNFDPKMSTEYIEKLYEICKFEKPVVVFADDPDDYKVKFDELNKTDNLRVIYKQFCEKNNLPDDSATVEIEETNYTNKSHYLFLCSSYHRVYLTWYKFIQDEFEIDHENKEILNWLYERANNNIARCFFTKFYVLVLRMPKYIRRNTVGFHNVNGPAIEWPGYGMYYINGRKLPEDIFLKTINKELTFKEFIELENEDIKASVITLIKEKFGNDELMKFLDAIVVDEKTINHSSGYSEIVRLFKTRTSFEFLNDLNGETNQPYAWLEMKCPSSGSIYLIDTSAHFTDALECMKFHRPTGIPMELKYDFSEFNN